MTSSSTILGPSGAPAYLRPQPSPELEAEVRERLKAIDRSLDVRWFETAVWNDRREVYEGRYGLTVRWPDSDPRWKLYRSGEIGEPFDLLGWFCEDPHDASSVPVEPTAIWERVRALLGRCDNARESWKRRMARAFEANAEQRERILREANEEIEDRLAEEFYGPHGPASRHAVPERIEAEAEAEAETQRQRRGGTDER